MIIWKLGSYVFEWFFLFFDLQCNKHICNFRNGGYMTSPLIGKYCGMQIPNLIPSHSNQLFLKFVSDSSMSSTGFRIFWDGTATGN